MSLLGCPNFAKQRQSVNHNLKKHCGWFVCGLTAWMAPKVITEITKVKLNSALKLITVSSGHRALFCNIINIDSFVLSNRKKRAHPNFTIYYGLQICQIISNYALLYFKFPCFTLKTNAFVFIAPSIFFLPEKWSIFPFVWCWSPPRILWECTYVLDACWKRHCMDHTSPTKQISCSICFSLINVSNVFEKVS